MTLSKSANTAEKVILEYFNINFGPFDRLNHDKPFYGNSEKPECANCYSGDRLKKNLKNSSKIIQKRKPNLLTRAEVFPTKCYC